MNRPPKETSRTASIASIQSLTIPEGRAIADVIRDVPPSPRHQTVGALKLVGAVKNAYALIAPTADGFIATVPRGVAGLVIAAETDLATGTVVLPPNPREGQTFYIASLNDVTELTIITSDDTRPNIGSRPVSQTQRIVLMYEYLTGVWI